MALSVTVTGLTPNTSYHFRACGQDENAAQAVCGTTLSFKTLAGTSYAFDRKWGSFGYGKGQFSEPSDIATDAGGNVYVADIARIQKFSSTGAYLDQWGSEGTANGQFEGQPSAIETDSSGNVYVAAPSGCCSSRIQSFSGRAVSCRAGLRSSG